MTYITGIHALNVNCSLETCGDWHASALRWDAPKKRESDGSLFGEYGIERGKHIPEHDERYNVANHIRALLDMLEAGEFGYAQGMNEDYICNAAYNKEIFEKVATMRGHGNWEAISAFMGKEYKSAWLDFLGGARL